MHLDDLTSTALDVAGRMRSYEQATYGEAWTIADRCVGLTKDVGDLVAIVQELEGRRPAAAGDPLERLTHELGDCLWVLALIGDRYDIELGAAFAKAMHDIEHAIGAATSVSPTEPTEFDRPPS